MIRKELGIENQCLIGHVGRFDEPKNHKKLLEIYKELLSLNSKYRLVLIGKGTLERQIKHLAKEYGIYDKILWLGIRKDVHKLLQAIDIFVFPSLFEGLGIAVIEAQATGLPCVISDAIPDEACITSLVHRLKIKDSASKWARYIDMLSNNMNKRESPIEELNKFGYSISDTARILECYYLNIIC